MSATVTFDTLIFAKKLIEAGIPAQAAEVHAETLKDFFDTNQATKQDLKDVERNLSLKIADLKNDLIKWVFGISFAQAAFILSCIKIMH